MGNSGGKKCCCRTVFASSVLFLQDQNRSTCGVLDVMTALSEDAHLARQTTLPVSPRLLRSAVGSCAISISIVRVAISFAFETFFRECLGFCVGCGRLPVGADEGGRSSNWIDRVSFRESRWPSPRKPSGPTRLALVWLSAE